MPRLRLNHEAAKRIGERYGLHTAEQTADFLGVDLEHVRDVCERGGRPSDEFIAAVLSKCATSFDELFDLDITGSYDVATPQATHHQTRD